MMNITKATLSDIPALCELLRSLFEQESEFSPDEQAQITGLTQLINNPILGQVFVVNNSDKVIAMASLIYNISTALGGRVAVLEDVIVNPSYRNTGIGSKLVDHVIQYAKNNAVLRLSLLTDNNNLAAQRFYQRHDFKPSTMKVFRQLLNKA